MNPIMMTASKVKMNQLKNKYLVIILGPTASGKTDTAIQIAETFNTEIISADSRQLYKELKKGTAIPAESQLKKIRHHFIGTISVHDYYNASMYEQDVLKELDRLYLKNDIVVMVGGSGMYIDVVCHGIDDLPAIDPGVRETLAEKLKNKGIQSLRLELKKIDPEYYSRADLKNPKRILKALEVFYLTGIPYSAFLSGPKKERGFKIIKIGLNPDRSELYERINTRVDSMIEKGLVEEAKSLYGAKECNALNTVGYKEIFEYLDGKMTLEQSVALIKRNTRRYARRQITWFRRDNAITWFAGTDIKDIVEYIRKEIGIIEEGLRRTNSNTKI
jgi:tRNA dimethylallyltransferase